LIVLRELNGLLEYLMMTRKPNMSFANSCVFPGGVCEKEDQATENSSFVEYGKITAIRETLEEAGLLLLP
jgi:8-oxo-dGTP pyrophosphatase MutT (NUDIX family)